MSKRKLEDELEADWYEGDTKVAKSGPGVKKNSLDSDEEDDVEEKAYDILAEDDIEGQEEGGGGYDGDVKITPFNMKEELEEGHFDTDGNYHWKKDGKLIRDNWLENIDWVKIKKKEPSTEENKDGNESESDYSSAASPFDHIAAYKQMLELMKPGETVAKSLRRLGGKRNLSASERWKLKKAGHDVSNEGNQQQVTDLTELANSVLTKTGNMDVYQESFEQITKKIADAEKKTSKMRTAKDYEDVLDMYADDFDEKEKARMEKQAQNRAEGAGASTQENKAETGTSETNNDVMWEFKWSEDKQEVYGPHSSEQMHAWVQEGYFKSPVLVRKAGSNGQFYTSSRVDFDLYI